MRRAPLAYPTKSGVNGSSPSSAPAPGHAATSELAAALIAHAAEHLARFKCPREIVFDTVLPNTSTGKLQRNLVRQRFWRGRDRSI